MPDLFFRYADPVTRRASSQSPGSNKIGNSYRDVVVERGACTTTRSYLLGVFPPLTHRQAGLYRKSSIRSTKTRVRPGLASEEAVAFGISQRHAPLLGRKRPLLRSRVLRTGASLAKYVAAAAEQTYSNNIRHTDAIDNYV